MANMENTDEHEQDNSPISQLPRELILEIIRASGPDYPRGGVQGSLSVALRLSSSSKGLREKVNKALLELKEVNTDDWRVLKAIIVKAPNVTALTYAGAANGRIFDIIHRIRCLRELSIPRLLPRFVSGARSFALARLSNLTRLDIDEADDLDNEDIYAISLLTRLRKLKLPKLDHVNDEGIAVLSRLTNLRVLHMEYAYHGFGEKAMRFVSALTNLEELRLDFTPVYGFSESGRRFRYLPPSLQSLSIRDSIDSDAAGRELEGSFPFAYPATNLRFLDLDCSFLETNERARDLSMLGPAPNMEILVLCYTSVNDAAMARVGEMRNLRKLTLASTEISDKGLVPVSHIKGLQRLNLRSCMSITDAGLAHLACHPALEELLVDYTAVTDIGIEHVASIPNLKALSLHRCQNVTRAGLERLEPLRLRELRTPDDATTTWDMYCEKFPRLSAEPGVLPF